MSSNFIHTQIDSESSNMYRSVFFKRMGEIADDTKEKSSHIYIKLKPDAIDFSYFTRDTDDPMVVRRETAWFSLPLVSSEQTDNFLLNTRQYELDIETTDTSFRLYYANGNTNFSNLETLKNELHPSSIGIREVLLCLFHDLNSAESDLRRHTSADTIASILTRLNGSEVYGCIWKKFAFYKALYDFETHYKHPDLRDELKVRYIEFLPKLLDEKIYDEIPVEHFHSKNWWLNPEQELEHLAEINDLYDLDSKTVRQIENCFLKKHAIQSALKLASGKWYKLHLIFMGLSALFFLLTWICWLNEQFAYTNGMWMSACAFGIMAIVTIAASKRARENFTNLIMPRILVAITTALFVLNITEELYLNMVEIEIKSIIWMGGVVGVIVYYLLYSESRQHSPAYQVKKFYHQRYNRKILPIIIYTFCVANIINLMVHLFVLNDMFVGNNEFVHSHFEKELDSIKLQTERYEDLSNILAQAYAYGSTWNLIKVNYGMGSYLTLKNGDSAIMQGRSKTYKTPNEKIVKSFLTMYNAYKSPISGIIKKDTTDTIVNRFIKNLSDSLTFEHYKSSPRDNDTIYQDTQKLFAAKGQVDEHRNSIQTQLDYAKNKNYLATEVTYKKGDTKETLNRFNEKKEILIIEPFEGEKKIYVRLFMAQVILSIFIGIAGQLIVSDKSVTETL